MWYILILSCFHLIWNYHFNWTWHNCSAPACFSMCSSFVLCMIYYSLLVISLYILWCQFKSHQRFFLFLLFKVALLPKVWKNKRKKKNEKIPKLIHPKNRGHGSTSRVAIEKRRPCYSSVNTIYSTIAIFIFVSNK